MDGAQNFELKKNKQLGIMENYINLKKKTQRSSSKIVTSEALQRVKNETLQESHLKFGTTDEGQNFRIK